MKATRSTKARGGCFGDAIKLAVVSAITLGVFLATLALFAPWGFYLGGSFHILPYWQGWGRMHSASGDYLLYLWMGPTSSKYTCRLRGFGELCTPWGERYPMTIGAEMDKHIGTNLNGKTIRIYGHHRAWNWSFTGDSRPRIDLQGQWKNPNIVLNDRGTLLTEFKPDGSLYPPHQRPAVSEVLQLILMKGGSSAYEAACAAQKK